MGALIGLATTALIQTRQFRREELNGVRERLGLTRGLRADLYAAKLVTEVSIKSEWIAAGSVWPVDLWVAQGHRLMAAMESPAEQAMIDTFSRFASINSMVAATRRPDGHLPLKEDKLGVKHLAGLIAKLDHAIGVFDSLETFYEERSANLQHPVRSRLRR